MDVKFIMDSFPFMKSSLGIIQHGSTTMGVSNRDSDVDLVVVYKPSDITNLEKLVVSIVEGSKFHIQNISIDEFEKLVQAFTEDMLTAKRDMNFLSGRVLSGKVIKDTQKVLLNKIEHAKNDIDFDLLYQKFYYQLLNDLKDLSIDEPYSRKIVIESIGDDLAILLLLKKNITTLNGKWIPKLLKNIVTDELFKKYTQLRFSKIDISDSEVSSLVVEWMGFLDEL